MSIHLLAIKFNHDPASTAGNALNIRRNAAEMVVVPEWQRGISTQAEDSVAAYAISETLGKTITIQAKLACTDPQITSIRIRAIQPPPPIPWYLPYYYGPNYYLWQMLLTQVNVLGEIKETEVTFRSNRESKFVTFELYNHRLLQQGVSVQTVVWYWQYRYGPYDQWKSFAVSKHKIYTVLRVPTEPWQQTPYGAANTQLPWVEVLDYACRWAARAYTLDDAAAKVTYRVYNLGNGVFEYGCPVGGMTVYAFPYFNCTAILERLRGGIGRGRYVNCSDCATMVSTFSNILGCDLWQSQMFTSGEVFPVNPVLVIGDNRWGPPCGLEGFGYHEVAWKNDCTQNDEVFDASLAVDSTAPPLPPYTPLLPANLRFGRTGDGLYRDMLSAPGGRQFCEPQPATRQRRIIY